MKKLLFLLLTAAVLCPIGTAFAAEPAGNKNVDAVGLIDSLPPTAIRYPSEVTKYADVNALRRLSL